MHSRGDGECRKLSSMCLILSPLAFLYSHGWLRRSFIEFLLDDGEESRKTPIPRPRLEILATRRTMAGSAVAFGYEEQVNDGMARTVFLFQSSNASVTCRRRDTESWRGDPMQSLFACSTQSVSFDRSSL